MRTMRFLAKKGPGRPRSFAAAVEDFTKEDKAEWCVEGPRTTRWLAESILEQGPAPFHRHFWWRRVLKATASDNGIDDHRFLSELIEVEACEDQLNIPELQVFEMMSRRLQLWEEVYSEQLRIADAGETGQAWLDERALFLGQRKSRGHARIAPSLETWIASRLSGGS